MSLIINSLCFGASTAHLGDMLLVVSVLCPNRVGFLVARAKSRREADAARVGFRFPGREAPGGRIQLSPGARSIENTVVRIRMAPYFQLAPSCDSMRTDSAKRVSDKKDGSGPQRHFDSGAIAPLELHGQTLLLAAHSDCLRSSCHPFDSCRDFHRLEYERQRSRLFAAGDPGGNERVRHDRLSDSRQRRANHRPAFAFAAHNCFRHH